MFSLDANNQSTLQRIMRFRPHLRSFKKQKLVGKMWINSFAKLLWPKKYVYDLKYRSVFYRFLVINDETMSKQLVLSKHFLKHQDLVKGQETHLLSRSHCSLSRHQRSRLNIRHFAQSNYFQAVAHNILVFKTKYPKSILAL